jgi:hypothetical protein
MNILEINNLGQKDYQDRVVVKLVIFDERRNVHYLENGLVGGGLESGENITAAAHRESLEEVGYKIEILKELGQVVAYRDILQKKYTTLGFTARILEKNTSATIQTDELDLKILVTSLSDAIKYFENKIADIEKNKELYTGDTYQSKLFNVMTALAFLGQAK